MKRCILTLTVTGALMVTGTGAAWADRGAPGSTFPEQPAGNLATACATLLSNPGTGLGGKFEQNASPGAIGILTGNYFDACFPA